MEITRIVGTDLEGEIVCALNAKNIGGMNIFSVRNEASSYRFSDLLQPQPLCQLYVLFLYIFCI